MPQQDLPQGDGRTMCAPTGLRPNFQPVRARALQ
nr:MAG TPA: hypothetical protein [Caudoviricetes sp.]